MWLEPNISGLQHHSFLSSLHLCPSSKISLALNLRVEGLADIPPAPTPGGVLVTSTIAVCLVSVCPVWAPQGHSPRIIHFDIPVTPTVSGRE